jgi:hypothetical protein
MLRQSRISRMKREKNEDWFGQRHSTDNVEEPQEVEWSGGFGNSAREFFPEEPSPALFGGSLSAR